MYFRGRKLIYFIVRQNKKKKIVLKFKKKIIALWERIYYFLFAHVKDVLYRGLYEGFVQKRHPCTLAVFTAVFVE